MKKIRGCQAVITAMRVTRRPSCFHVCVVRWVFVLLRLPAASVLLGALPEDVAGVEQAPSGQAVGSVQWGKQCWLPVGFLPVMESPEATGVWGWKGEGRLGGLCLLEGKGAAGQASLGMGTPFQIPLTPAANPILREAGIGGMMLEQPSDMWDELAPSSSPQHSEGGLR